MSVYSIPGLPDELWRIEEEVLIKVRVEHRKYNKPATVIEGINPKTHNLNDIAKRLKKWLACGGAVKDNKIILFGDHRADIVKYLLKLGFKKDYIQIL